MNARKQVLIYDKQFLTRKGFATLIDSLKDFEVVGEIDSPGELKSSIYELNPDVVIIGIVNDDEVLINEIQSLKSEHSASFLVITGVFKKMVVQKLLNSGAKCILTKTCSEEEIIEGLRAVAANNRFYCNTILDIVMNHEDEFANCDPTSLSDREYEVLELIARGHKTNQIAEELYLSVHTVNSHRKNILKKLNVKSPTELIVFALESGLVSAQKA